jgi:hypothetical protein
VVVKSYQLALYFQVSLVTCDDVFMLSVMLNSHKENMHEPKVSAVMKLVQACCADACEPWYFLSLNK